MKQKDKKQLKRFSAKLSNINLPAEDVLDELQENASFKAKRTPEKSSTSFKNGLQLKRGRVVEIKSNYANIVEIDSHYYTCTLSGRLKQFRSESKGLTAVGDFVEVDVASAPHYRIENILLRNNTLSRYSEGGFQKEIIVAANIDQVIITASWHLPDIKPGLLDRYICIANIYGLEPVICINKIDLCENLEKVDELSQYYKSTGVSVIATSAVKGTGMDELKKILTDKDSVFSGQSGTGKTSLINYLEPNLLLATGEISGFNEKGRHTTTQAILIPWSFGGHLVDTPGIKTINLHSNNKPQIPSVFPGFRSLYEQCYYRSCLHINEEQCAVKDAVESGTIPLERYESYLRLMESL